MASTAKDVNLLFFDTFYHDQNENVEELNIDLIQFSKPVVVYELRVIPLRTQVEPNLGKGYRLGGTLPSEFKLDVFVNNLNRPSASTFEKLGQLDYKENKNIQLKLDREVPTDGLILKGWYRTVTLAVYGWVTTVCPKEDSPPPPPPPLAPHQATLVKPKIPGLDEEAPPSHKHPIDFINEQVQKQHQQNLLPTPTSQTVAPGSAPLAKNPSKPAPLEEAFVDVLMKPSQRSRDRGRSSRASSHEGGRADEFVSFPPEPKEPYESHGERRDDEDWGGRRVRSRDRSRSPDRVERRDGDSPRSLDRRRSMERMDLDRPRSADKWGRERSLERRDAVRSRERSLERRDRDLSRSRERSLERRDTNRSRERSLERRDRDLSRSRERSLERKGVVRSRERSLERRDRSRERSLEKRDARSRDRSLERRDFDRLRETSERSTERRDIRRSREQSLERSELDRLAEMPPEKSDIDFDVPIERRDVDRVTERSLERREKDIDRLRELPSGLERKERDLGRSLEKRDIEMRRSRERSLERKERPFEQAVQRSLDRRERVAERPADRSLERIELDSERPKERLVDEKDWSRERDLDRPREPSIEKRDRDVDRLSERSFERRERDLNRPRERSLEKREMDQAVSAETKQLSTDRNRSFDKRDRSWSRDRSPVWRERLEERTKIEDPGVDRPGSRDGGRDADHFAERRDRGRHAVREREDGGGASSPVGGDRLRDVKVEHGGEKGGMLPDRRHGSERDPGRPREKARDDLGGLQQHRGKDKGQDVEIRDEWELSERARRDVDTRDKVKDKDRDADWEHPGAGRKIKRDLVDLEKGDQDREKDELERREKHDAASERSSRSARGSPKPTRRSRSRSGSRSRKRSRSGSRSRKRSRSPHKSKKRSRSGSSSRHRQRVSPRPTDRERRISVERDEEEDVEDDMECQEVYTRAVTTRSSRRRGHNSQDDGEGEGYEDISSEEDVDNGDAQMQVLDMYELEEDQWGGNAANPLDFYLTPLLVLKNPSLSGYEVESLQYMADMGDIDMPAEARTLLDIMYQFGDQDALHQERWVMAMEEVPKLLEKGLAYLLQHEKKTDVLNVLIDWVMEGCDPDIAMTQPEAAFKIRHLKMGMRLAGALCSQDQAMALMLLKRGVQGKLLDLYESPYIVFSMKHMALRALAQTTHFPVGMQWMLGTHPDMEMEKTADTGYQRLVHSLLSPKIVKLTMSVTALLRKIHFYETLSELFSITESLALASANLCEGDGQTTKDGGEEDDEGTQLREDDETRVLAALETISTILTDPHELTGQTHNAVPYNLVMDNKVKSPLTTQSLFTLCDNCGLLESILVLLATPTTSSCPSIYTAAHQLLQMFTSTHEGLLYLASHNGTTNGILRCLLQMVEEPDDSGEDVPSRRLGIELIYHLQTLQFVDQMFHYQAVEMASKAVDSSEVLSILHGLHTMMLSAGNRDLLLGRTITSKVLSYGQNVEIFFRFLEKTGDEEFDEQVSKSVSANYCSQLLLTVVKTSTNVHLLENYAQRMLQFCQDATNPKLQQLNEWLSPTTKLTSFDLDGLPSMIAQLKIHADEIKKTPPPALITTVRALYSLIQEAALSVTVDNPGKLSEAKYRYVIGELYSAECLPIFLNILQKLSESQLKVWQQGIPYATDQWLTHFSLIKPTLSLVHATLCQIIQAFREEKDTIGDGAKKEEGDDEPLVINPFMDLTAIPVLLELHTVMCSVPTSSLYNNDLNKIQRDICDTLLAFTQEELQQTQTDDALSKSLWTLMLRELLKYTIKSPYTYMGGLLILSELLPLPFPLLTKDTVSEEENDAAVMSRKLWSVHLQSATPELFSVLDTLSGTGCQPLQHLMRRVCWQIADLAAPSALRITKILLDILMVNLKPKKPTQTTDGAATATAGTSSSTAATGSTVGASCTASGEDKKNGAGEEELTAVRTVSIHTAKTLNLFAYLLSHPGIKAALLQLLGTSINSDPKYKDFLPIMLQLLNQAAETPAEIQAQEGIVSMIHNICDLEISMVNTDLPVTLAEHLANSLPESILMAEVMAALLEHIGNSVQSYASILPCLRMLIVLTDHDYGFFHLKMNLERNLAAVHTLLSRINNTFSKDNSDCVSTLSAVLELLSLLVSIEDNDEASVTRTKVITHTELRHFLLWSPDARHPLEELEELSRDEETLQSTLPSITALTTILRKPSTPEADSNLEEILLPVPAPLTELYAQRAVYTILDSEDERLSPSYWLANPAADEPDAKPEVLRCDLQAICQSHLPDFNLEQELTKETSSADAGLDIVKPKRPKDRRKSHEVININRGKPGRKPFVAPMRGRGIMSHAIMSNRSNDLFRTRAPNTSRPPSMHVDDFVKMENSQQEQQHHEEQQQVPLRPPLPPLGPPGRDGRDKEPPRNRGGFDRGGGFGMPGNHGGFFTPPGNYGRRDPIMHDNGPGPHSNMRGGGRGGMLSMDRPRSNFMAPRPFSRGRPDRQGPPQMDRHGIRSGRFSPGGRGGRGGHWGRGGGRDMGEQGRFAGGFRGRRDLGRHARSFTK